MKLTEGVWVCLNPVQEPVFQISVTGFSLNLVQLNMFSWCEWDIGSTCNWRRKLYIQMLQSCTFSWILASMLHQYCLKHSWQFLTWRGVWKRCLSEFWSFVSPFTCFTSKHKWICVLITSYYVVFFTSTAFEKTKKNSMSWCSENIPLWMSNNATWFSFLDNLPLLLHLTNTCPFRLWFLQW